jgi:hypothetical protein
MPEQHKHISVAFHSDRFCFCFVIAASGLEPELKVLIEDVADSATQPSEKKKMASLPMYEVETDAGWQPYDRATNALIAAHVSRDETAFVATLTDRKWVYELDLIAGEDDFQSQNRATPTSLISPQAVFFGGVEIYHTHGSLPPTHLRVEHETAPALLNLPCCTFAAKARMPLIVSVCE